MLTLMLMLCLLHYSSDDVDSWANQAQEYEWCVVNRSNWKLEWANHVHYSRGFLLFIGQRMKWKMIHKGKKRQSQGSTSRSPSRRW
jgi:hypothetical protein